MAQPGPIEVAGHSMQGRMPSPQASETAGAADGTPTHGGFGGAHSPRFLAEADADDPYLEITRDEAERGGAAGGRGENTEHQMREGPAQVSALPGQEGERADADADAAVAGSSHQAESSRFGRFRAQLCQVVQHWLFTASILLLIAYDTFLMGHDDLSHEREPTSSLHKVVAASDWVILGCFTLEMFLKLVALGPGRLPSCRSLGQKYCGFSGGGDDEPSGHSEETGDHSMLPDTTASADKAKRESSVSQQALAGEDAAGTTGHLHSRFRQKGYFDDTWNLFDCFIVVATWVLVPAQYALADNETMGRLVRIFRLVRPLRAFRTFDGTKDVLKTFPRAIPDMGDVLALLLFVFVVYAILGLNLFGIEGQFHGRCVVEDGYSVGTHGLLLKGNFDDVEPLCNTDSTCPEGFRCSCKARLIPPMNSLEKPPYAYQDPVSGDPGCLFQEAARSWADSGEFNEKPQCPHYGYECFDNFLLALYTIFTKITLDTWTTSMWWAQDAAGDVAGLSFYLSLVGIIAFNVVNLNVAVISSAYQSVRDERREINHAKALHRKATSTQRASPAAAPSLFGRLCAAVRDWYERGAQRRTTPMPALALAVRRLCTAPLTVDESGNRVPVEVTYMAAVRNLEVKFGPAFGQWTLISGPAAAAVLAPKEDTPSCTPTPQGADAAADAWGGSLPTDADYASYVSSTGLAPAAEGEDGGGRADGADGADEERHQRQGIMIGATVAEGWSTDEERVALRAQMVKFLKSARREELLGPMPPSEGVSTSYLDQVVMAMILLNTICMTMEHFEGSAVSVDVPHKPTDHCCDSRCHERSAVECPRGFLMKDPGWAIMELWTEGFFVVFFSLEVIFKVVAAWSLPRYLVDNWPMNMIDMLIVVSSDAIFIIELQAPSIFNLTVFRLVRIARAMRIVSRFTRLRNLVRKAAASFKTILHVLCVLVFWHVLAALLGMQIFGCNARNEAACALEDGECPEGCSLRSMGKDGEAVCFYSDEELFDHCPWDEYNNFNSFGPAIVLLVFVTTGEGWVEKMEMSMRAVPSALPGLIFFIVFYVVSFYMLYNLFIGVILEEFELTDEEKQGLQLANFRVHVLKELRRRQAVGAKLDRLNMFSLGRKPAALMGGASGAGGSGGPEGRAAADAEPAGGDAGREGGGGGRSGAGGQAAGSPDGGARGAEEGLGGGALPRHEEAGQDVTICGCLPPATPNEQQPDAAPNLRLMARNIAQDPWFERGILLTILVSAIFLAMQSPIREYSTIDLAVAQYSDYVFFVIFAFEFVVKILEHGVLWEHELAYFRQGWNVLDFFILMLQLLDMIGVDGLKSLRVMRVLRPLRLLNKVKSLQLLLASIKASAADMFNVLFLWLFMCLVFAICAINLFAGKLFACNDGDFVGPPLNPDEPPGSAVGWRENCVGNFYTTENEGGSSYVADHLPTAILRPRVWSNPADGASGMGWHFDNFAMAFQTLFEVSTFEQWSDYVYSCVDVTQVGQQPIAWSNTWNVLFFHLWVVMSCFFVLQLVIGVLIDAINQKSGASLYTDLQRNWLRMKLRMARVKPLSPVTLPTSPFRLRLWRLSNDVRLVNGVTCIIIVNIVLMASESYAQPQWWSDIMTSINILFITVYIVELLIKFVAYLHLFFLDAWNLFDLLVVLSSVIELAIVRGSAGMSVLRTLRLLKVLRTIRLVRRAKRLRSMINALMASIPPILSSMLFLGLFIFLVAVLGVQFFSGVREGYGIHRRNNFHTVSQGIILLIRVITGENWETTMRDCAIEPPFCTSDAEAQRITGNPDMVGDCGNTVVAFIVFDVFFLLGSNILLNLFVAVLLESFFNFQVQHNFVLSENHLENFQTVWRELDPMGKGALHVHRLRELLEKLHASNNPLGSCVLANEFKFRTVRVELVQGKVDGCELVFDEVLHVLGLHVVGTQGLPYPEVLVRQEKLTYYAQLAAVSKMTALYRSVKERQMQQMQPPALPAPEARDGEEDGDQAENGAESSREGMKAVVDMVHQYAARIAHSGAGVAGDSNEGREDEDPGHGLGDFLASATLPARDTPSHASYAAMASRPRSGRLPSSAVSPAAGGGALLFTTNSPEVSPRGPGHTPTSLRHESSTPLALGHDSSTPFALGYSPPARSRQESEGTGGQWRGHLRTPSASGGAGGGDGGGKREDGEDLGLSWKRGDNSIRMAGLGDAVPGQEERAGAPGFQVVSTGDGSEGTAALSLQSSSFGLARIRKASAGRHHARGGKDETGFH